MHETEITCCHKVFNQENQEALYTYKEQTVLAAVQFSHRDENELLENKHLPII